MSGIKLRPLAMPDQNNPQIREYIEAIERGRNDLHLFPHENGQWSLKQIGGENFGIFPTRDQAFARAREFTRDGTLRTSAIITHDESGLITNRVDKSFCMV